MVAVLQFVPVQQSQGILLDPLPLLQEGPELAFPFAASLKPESSHFRLILSNKLVKLIDLPTEFLLLVAPLIRLDIGIDILAGPDGPHQDVVLLL